MENQKEPGSSLEQSKNPMKEEYVEPIIIPCYPAYSYLENNYRKNEIIVTFKSNPTKDEISTVKGFFKKMGIHNIKTIKCGNCELPIQLWLAEGIDTVISAKGVKAGSGPGTQTVGECYSLNFLSRIPHHAYQKWQPGKSFYNSHDKEVITVAVLDTGLDSSIVDPGYTGYDLQNRPGFYCFSDTVSGWNFVDDNDDTSDDNPGRHGSLVTQYIINEFKKSPERTVKIIPLKTHDANGVGDLFKIYCAVQFAVAKGAKIINASWGVYAYETETPGSVFDLFRTLVKPLKEQGILFVTAAGNETGEDATARSIYRTQHNGNDPTPEQLRNLNINRFLPACLSDKEDNLITVTTSNEDKVDPTENYSPKYVDLAVRSDSDNSEDFEFLVPFAQTNGEAFVGGSSFATAIATGVIGANSDKVLYAPNVIDKNAFIAGLIDKSLCRSNGKLIGQVKDGLCIKR